MKFTILMSTYNGERFLAEQLDSIRAQTVGYENIEVLIRDDASTDGTCSVIQGRMDGGITLVRGQNVGPARSFWKLVERCGEQSDYYAFADQDDIWFEDKLECAVKAIQEVAGPVLYYSNAEAADAKGRPLGRPVIRRPNHLAVPTIMAGLPALGCTMVFNREALELIRRVGPDGIEMHDRTCFLSLYLCGTVVYDENPRMYYRQHDNNVIGNQGRRDLSYWKKRFRQSRTLWFGSREHDAVVQAGDMLRSYGLSLRGEDEADLNKICRYRHHPADKWRLLTNPHVRYLHPRVRRSYRMRILLNLF